MKFKIGDIIAVIYFAAYTCLVFFFPLAYGTDVNIDIANLSASASKGLHWVGFSTDGLKNFGGKAFTFAITLRCDLSKIKGDPAIFSNKDWQSGANPGFALAARNDRITFNAACRNAPTDYVVTSPRRMDLFRILPDGKDDRNLIAVSVDPEALVTVFQKCPNGRDYWFCVSGKGINPTTMLDWNVGQDATGRYKYTAEIEVSGVRVWDRALTLDELRKLDLQ